MSGSIEGEDRTQATLISERIDDYVAEDSPVRVVDVFIDDLHRIRDRTALSGNPFAARSGLGFPVLAESAYSGKRTI